MFETACKFEKAFDRMDEEDEQYVNYFGGSTTPQSGDWEKARVFVQFLKTFYEITLTFSASLNVNSIYFFSEFIYILFNFCHIICNLRKKNAIKRYSFKKMQRTTVFF